MRGLGGGVLGDPGEKRGVEMLQNLGGRQEALITRERAPLKSLIEFLTAFVSSELMRTRFAAFIFGKIGAGAVNLMQAKDIPA
jgi:hypothetical protein